MKSIYLKGVILSGVGLLTLSGDAAPPAPATTSPATATTIITTTTPPAPNTTIANPTGLTPAQNVLVNPPNALGTTTTSSYLPPLGGAMSPGSVAGALQPGVGGQLSPGMGGALGPGGFSAFGPAISVSPGSTVGFTGATLPNNGANNIATSTTGVTVGGGSAQATTTGSVVVTGANGPVVTSSNVIVTGAGSPR